MQESTDGNQFSSPDALRKPICLYFLIIRRLSKGREPGMTLSQLLEISILLFSIAGILVVSIYLRKNPAPRFRSNEAIKTLEKEINRVTESGSSLQVSLGNSAINTTQSASGLSGLNILKLISQKTIKADHPPLASAGDGSLFLLSQNVLRKTYQDANILQKYDPQSSQIPGVTPFSYAAGMTPFQKETDIKTNIWIGNYGPEIGLLVESGARQNSCNIGGSDQLTAQAVLFGTADAPLIGEDLFSTGAYLQSGVTHSASLIIQDILRMILIVGMIVGSILKLFGFV
jgi:hypothetical protein